VSLARISGALIAALDADQSIHNAARQMFQLSDADVPTEEQIAKASAPLKKAAIHTLMTTRRAEKTDPRPPAKVRADRRQISKMS